MSSDSWKIHTKLSNFKVDLLKTVQNMRYLLLVPRSSVVSCIWTGACSVQTGDSSHASYLNHWHDDVIRWKHFLRYWPFVQGIHRSLVISPHKGQWRGALVFSFICAWAKGCVNNQDSVDLRPHGAHYCPACRTTLVATRFRVAVICPIIQVPHCIRVFFYFVWFVFINHIFQFYHELYTYCNILDIYLS